MAWLRSFVVDLIISWWALPGYYRLSLTATFSLTLALHTCVVMLRPSRLSDATSLHRCFSVDASLGTSRCFCTEELLYSGSHWLVLLHVAPLMPLLLPLCCDSKAWIRSRREEGQDLGNNSPTMASKQVPEENIKGLCAPVTVFSVCICVLSSL